MVRGGVVTCKHESPEWEDGVLYCLWAITGEFDA